MQINKQEKVCRVIIRSLSDQMAQLHTVSTDEVGAYRQEMTKKMDALLGKISQVFDSMRDQGSTIQALAVAIDNLEKKKADLTQRHEMRIVELTEELNKEFTKKINNKNEIIDSLFGAIRNIKRKLAYQSQIHERETTALNEEIQKLKADAAAAAGAEVDDA